MKIVGQVDFLVGGKKSQNVLFHSPDWVSAQKVRLYDWTADASNWLILIVKSRLNILGLVFVELKHFHKMAIGNPS